jgi:hypothetical protein
MLQLVLRSESTIGSSQIDVAKDCAKAFPVMDDLAAWRLYEGGTIGFANAARKPRIRLPTQDNHGRGGDRRHLHYRQEAGPAGSTEQVSHEFRRAHDPVSLRRALHDGFLSSLSASHGSRHIDRPCGDRRNSRTTGLVNR